MLAFCYFLTFCITVFIFKQENIVLEFKSKIIQNLVQNYKI